MIAAAFCTVPRFRAVFCWSIKFYAIQRFKGKAREGVQNRYQFGRIFTPIPDAPPAQEGLVLRRYKA
jgi:hypothetical protein